MGPKKIVESVSDYYEAKLEKHSTEPQGVDWNSRESQFLRFEQLLKVCNLKSSFSLLDYGCGYGALVEVIRDLTTNVKYQGFDISEKMIQTARRKYAIGGNVSFTASMSEIRSSDYTVASGIFNVKLDHTTSDWTSYIHSTLDQIDVVSSKGFSFNMLTSYSDMDKMKSNLYYADPKTFFDLCKQRYSKNVAVLHDYGLFEFTVIVRKIL